MERKTCPFLGLPDDSKTSLAFPSEGNYCHKASPPTRVSGEHQRDVCLSGQHGTCPVFLAQKAAPLPAALAAGPPPRKHVIPDIRTAVLLGLAAVVSMAGVFTGGQRIADRVMALANSQSAGGMGQLLPLTGLAQPTPTPFEPTSSLLAGGEPVPVPTKACVVPERWEAHIVQPTDSIFRFSLLSGVSVEEIQRANCMGSLTYLQLGSTLYLPAAEPTLVSPTMTVAPIWVPAAPVISGGDDGESNANESGEAQPATSAPPTAVPPTAVPPTTAPPTTGPPADRGNNKDENKRKDEKKDKDNGKNNKKDKDKGKGKGGG